MRVLLVSTEYPPYIFGGGATFMHNLALGLTKRGVDVVVLTRGHGREKGLHYSTEDTVRKVAVHSPDKPPRHLWFQLNSIGVLRMLVEKLGVDIVHANSFSAALLFYTLAHRNPRIPRLVTIHGYPRHYLHLSTRSLRYGISMGQVATYVLGYPLWEHLLRMELAYSSKVVAVADFIRKSIIEDYSVDKGKVEYIPNGIDIAAVREKARHCKKRVAGDGEYIVVSGGRLFYEKGHILLIHAAKKALRMGLRGLRLYIFGDGPLRPLLEKMVRRQGLQRYVKLLGRLPHSRALCLIGMADLVVVPSIYEIMPMLVLEAVALEKPVLLLNSCYIAELTRLGIRVDTANNISELASKMARIAASAEAMEEAKRRAKLNYTALTRTLNISRIVEMYLDLYTRIMKR